MRELAFMLLLFSGCAGCIYLDEEARQHCVPQCGEYYYTGKIQDGKCVCDTAKVKR